MSYEDSIHRAQGLYVFLSAGDAFGHEADFFRPLFSALAAADPDGRRRGRWTLEYVLIVSVLMILEPSRTLADRFLYARQMLVAMFAGRRRPGRSYQGFVKAQARLTDCQRRKIQRHLRRRHRQIAGSFWQRDGWLAFSADGTRIETPRTAANEQAFGCAGRTKTGPQLSLTSLYHMGTGLPWAWRIGPGTESEQGHLAVLARTLPRGSLLVIDAGFASFDLLRSLRARGVHVLVRMGSNRTLLTGREDARTQIQGQQVWLWPTRKQTTCPPLPLRLVRIETAHQTPVYLTTSVLDAGRLTDRQVGAFYRMRWGQEVFYRSFKRTLEQHRMRSVAASGARRELDGAMTAYLVLGLWSVEALLEARHDPLDWSPAASLRVIRRAMRPLDGHDRGGILSVRLRKAVKDSYVRKGPKDARNWPHKKNDPPAGVPQIRPATDKEKRRVQRIYSKDKAA